MSSIGQSSDAGEDIGKQIYELIARLYPICRSITGNGVRETLSIIDELLPLKISEVPSGAAAYDWFVPHEWNITEAWIRDKLGRTIVDFRDHNLHVMSYSVPVNGRIKLAALREHIHTIPEHEDRIPYRTSYYNENWGFCMADSQARELRDDEYDVRIDSTLEPGHLTYAECLIPGESTDEVLLFAHCCHPSLCNDNLTGLSILAHLGRWLAGQERRLTYRIVFAPGTIGSLVWMSRNESVLPRIRYGLIASLLGDAGGFTYKRTRSGTADIDQIVEHALSESGQPYSIIDFVPWGYDERQFNSPGFALPVGRLTRTPNGEYGEYHTSADNLDIVSATRLTDSFRLFCSIIDIIEGNIAYVNQAPYGEPQLGRRGLYGSLGGQAQVADDRLALLWTLNLSDGEHSLLEIAARSGLSFATIRRAADALLAKELLLPLA